MMITRNEEEKCNTHSYAVLYYVCTFLKQYFSCIVCTHHMRHIYLIEK